MFFCEQDSFLPPTPIQALKTGILTYAGGDSTTAGLSYRVIMDLDAATLIYLMRGHDASGALRWLERESVLALPIPLFALLSIGAQLAPTLREVVDPVQPRYAVPDIIHDTSPAWEQQDRALTGGFLQIVISRAVSARILINLAVEGGP